MGYVIGCDLGSQSAKAVLLSPDGTVIGSASAGYSMEHPHSGWAEQDPAAYREGLAEVIRTVIANSTVKPTEVTHLGLSSQVDGVVPIDEHLRPLRSAIIWLDRRATAQVARFGAAMSADEIFARTGLNLDASHTAPKMMWLRDNEPDVYARATSLPSVGGYALAWLTGRSIQDHANSSSTLLYDVVARDWSDELLDAAALDRAKLPEIGAATDIAGHLTGEAADALGLTTDCQVVVSTGDDHASCLGAGGVRPGVVVDIVGTAEPVGVASSTPVFDETRLVETHAHAVDGSYLIENPGFVSGGNTLWFAKNVLRISQQEFFDLASTSVPGARGVRFIPALTGSMTPRWNDGMRGSFAGLSMNHDSADMARAIIEANSFAFRDIFGRLRALGLAESVRVVGGGARSSLWLTTKATLCGIPITRVMTEETSAAGGALLAAVAAGTFRDLEDAVDQVVELHPASIDPDPASAEGLEEAYREYRALFDALESSQEKEPDRVTLG
ncbi:MAG TPA: FGGY family carbohydrate kinase [Galbitalea sp.]|nr:FGGY family carbohydrate kinase [Galbitalea sp.]